MWTHPEATPASFRDRFLADHRRLEVLLERLIAAFEANDREDIARLWAELERGLCAHLHEEETRFFPGLLQTSGRTARVLIQEHRHIRARLAELGVALDLHAVRLDVARAFIDELRAHARSEDRLLYPWADERIGECDGGSLVNALPIGLDVPRKEEGT